MRDPCSSRRARSHVALVCGGGGVTGAAYQIGCLRALDELLDVSVLESDTFVGVSCGAVITSLLAAGVPPAEIYEDVVHGIARPLGFPTARLFRTPVADFGRSLARAPRVLGRALWSGMRRGHGLADAALALLDLLPPGLLENGGLRDYVRAVITSRGVKDSFEALRQQLYVIAVDLESGEPVAFGEEGLRDVPVSVAVQASCAVPGLFRPVRVNGRDYVDGAVQKTAHVKLAIEEGARLVFCVNPAVPAGAHGPVGGGAGMVVDKALRALLHGRLRSAMDLYAREYPDVDVVLLQPDPELAALACHNVMRFDSARDIATLAYQGIVRDFTDRREHFAALLACHGVGLRSPAEVPWEPRPYPYRSPASRRMAGGLLTTRVRNVPA